ncbi:MAG: protein BatD [Calditrichaeota bacterium]|nr:MAG: protein BatD [Calditrichota bacterium]
MAAGAYAQNLELNAYVDRTTIGVNQQFELNVELSGTDANRVPQPDLPDLTAFATFIGSSSSQNIQIVNGRMTVSKTYTHHFIATKVGKFRIPAIVLRYKGRTISSDPIEIEIVKTSGGGPPQAGQNRGRREASNDLSELLFLKATVSKRRVYQNEPVVVSYKIYTAVNVTNYGISQLPNMVGFWSEEFELPQRPRLYTEVVNGRQYRVAEIKKLALFPQGPGEKTVEPLVIECEVQLPRRRRRDLFDSFFDDPFFGRSERRVIRANPVQIEVVAVPLKERPADLSGAVGSFSLRAAVDKSRVKTNEAVTLRVDISGSGNIKILPQPKVNFPADFEVYDPKINESITRKGAAITGNKTFEYVMIPRFAGEQIIKPIRFSYFDLASKSYRTLTTDPIRVSVEKGAQQFSNVGMAASKEDVKFIGKDIRFIQIRMPEFKRVGRVFYKSAIFYALLVLPLFALAGAVGYRRHVERVQADVAYARSRKANQMALKRLKKAQKKLGEGESKAFYAEVSSALMGYIGDKFNVAAAGLITDQVETMLRERGIQAETVSNYIDCLQTCDYKRFAPTEADRDEMKAFFDKARKAIIALEREI